MTNKEREIFLFGREIGPDEPIPPPPLPLEILIRQIIRLAEFIRKRISRRLH